MSRSQSNSSRTSVGDGTWIGWFVGLPGHEFLCRVPTDYIEDKFNLTGLENSVNDFCQALETILDTDFDSQSWSQSVDTANAEKLYGLIHVRYILSARGIDSMCLKYERGDFGVCPRFYCMEQETLPLGLSDVYGQSHVKLYCPRCQDVFQPRSRHAQLDGAMFGTSFPHMFLMQMPTLRPPPSKDKYVARLFGFQLHKKALMPTESPVSKSTPSKSIPLDSLSMGAVQSKKRLHF